MEIDREFCNSEWPKSFDVMSCDQRRRVPSFQGLYSVIFWFSDMYVILNVSLVVVCSSCAISVLLEEKRGWKINYGQGDVVFVCDMICGCWTFLEIPMYVQP